MLTVRAAAIAAAAIGAHFEYAHRARGQRQRVVNSWHARRIAIVGRAQGSAAAARSTGPVSQCRECAGVIGALALIAFSSWH